MTDHGDGLVQSRIKMEDESSSISCLCQKARSIWLSSACTEDDMKTVETLYRQAWTLVEGEPIAKKPKIKIDSSCGKKAGLSEDQVKAGEKLALILLQSNRAKEADEILEKLGYVCRLSESVLNYSSTFENINTTKKLTSKVEIPCRLYENVFTEEEIQMLDSVFLNPTNSYWTDHAYQVEPPSPYFSYLIPLNGNEDTDDYGLLGHLVRRLRKILAVEWKTEVEDASFCEMWAHNRPHATGHQFHFDSDNEGCTGRMIRNPICSTIVYLTGSENGGPSVITNQRLASRHMADKGWLCFPSSENEEGKRNVRLGVFDGKVLHGVVPGKPRCTASESDGLKKRVTVMFAFWRRIRSRDTSDDGKQFGAARLLPKENEWARQLRKQPNKQQQICTSHSEIRPVHPIPIDCVYATMKGTPWTRKLGFPDYDQIFQGF